MSGHSYVSMFLAEQQPATALPPPDGVKVFTTEQVTYAMHDGRPKQLGRGHFSVVYQATLLSPEYTEPLAVAVKVPVNPDPTQWREQDLLQLLFTEAEVGRSVAGCKHCAEVYGLCIVPPTAAAHGGAGGAGGAAAAAAAPFPARPTYGLVMHQYSCNLHELQRRRLFSPEQKLQACYQAATGLHDLHGEDRREHWTCGDFKPENLLVQLGPDGVAISTVVVSDFGFCALSIADDAHAPSRRAQLLAAQALKTARGTRPYTAPEVLFRRVPAPADAAAPDSSPRAGNAAGAAVGAAAAADAAVTTAAATAVASTPACAPLAPPPHDIDGPMVSTFSPHLPAAAPAPATAAAAMSAAVSPQAAASPQAVECVVTRASDMWSFGISALEILSGVPRPDWGIADATLPPEVVTALLTGAAPATTTAASSLPRQLLGILRGGNVGVPTLPPEIVTRLEALINGCCAVNPQDRWTAKKASIELMLFYRMVCTPATVHQPSLSLTSLASMGSGGTSAAHVYGNPFAAVAQIESALDGTLMQDQHINMTKKDGSSGGGSGGGWPAARPRQWLADEAFADPKLFEKSLSDVIQAGHAAGRLPEYLRDVAKQAIEMGSLTCVQSVVEMLLDGEVSKDDIYELARLTCARTRQLDLALLLLHQIQTRFPLHRDRNDTFMQIAVCADLDSRPVLVPLLLQCRAQLLAAAAVNDPSTAAASANSTTVANSKQVLPPARGGAGGGAGSDAEHSSTAALISFEAIPGRDLTQLLQQLDPGAGNSSGFCALHSAAEYNKPEIATLLITFDSSLVHKPAAGMGNQLPVHSAASHGNHRVLARLLQAGADPREEKVPFDGYNVYMVGSALHLAAIYGHVRALALLLLHAVPELSGPWGDSGLNVDRFIVTDDLLRDTREFLETRGDVLLKLASVVDSRNAYGMSPLHVVCFQLHLERQTGPQTSINGRNRGIRRTVAQSSLVACMQLLLALGATTDDETSSSCHMAQNATASSILQHGPARFHGGYYGGNSRRTDRPADRNPAWRASFHQRSANGTASVPPEHRRGGGVSGAPTAAPLTHSASAFALTSRRAQHDPPSSLSLQASQSAAAAPRSHGHGHRSPLSPLAPAPTLRMPSGSPTSSAQPSTCSDTTSSTTPARLRADAPAFEPHPPVTGGMPPQPPTVATPPTHQHAMYGAPLPPYHHGDGDAPNITRLEMLSTQLANVHMNHPFGLHLLQPQLYDPQYFAPTPWPPPAAFAHTHAHGHPHAGPFWGPAPPAPPAPAPAPLQVAPSSGFGDALRAHVSRAPGAPPLPPAPPGDLNSTNYYPSQPPNHPSENIKRR